MGLHIKKTHEIEPRALEEAALSGGVVMGGKPFAAPHQEEVTLNQVMGGGQGPKRAVFRSAGGEAAGVREDPEICS